MNRRGSLCAGLLSALLLTAPVWGALRVMHHELTINDATESVSMLIDFNRPPDFITVDPLQRQADSFALFLDVDFSEATGQLQSSELYAIGADTQITGGRIAATSQLWHRALFQRPPAGPWRDPLDYTLDERTVGFTTTFAALGYGGGELRGFILCAEYGAQSDFVYFTTVPEPTVAAELLLGTLLALGRTRRSRADPR